MLPVTYTYDSTAGGNYGKALRTGMSDVSGITSYIYDTRGRLSQETRTISGTSYATSYTYDDINRVNTITYPTNEVVTNTYNGRGLPYSVSGSVAGSLVTVTSYNGLGAVTQINLGNGLKTVYGYWGIDHDTTSYGRLWEIKTLPQAGGTALQDTQYTWDAGGNLTQRYDLVASTTENFTYDSLDRLTGVSGAYSESYIYNTIGNIISKGGNAYTYGTKPHAVTAVGASSYAYDANGNMTTRGSQTIVWDIENRVNSVSGGASFIYDGDGNRVKKTEGGETILYVNQYYEKNLTTGVVTTYYYLGNKLVFKRSSVTQEYVHQDHLGSTVLLTDTAGDEVTGVSYYPYGSTRSGYFPDMDIMFTGQRKDATGLYYYGARYYDTGIGRFISPDTVVQSFSNPQTLNRYSYCLNNPLKYVDPSGHLVIFDDPSFQAFLGQWDITSGGSMYYGDPSALLSDWLRLKEGWDAFASVEPGVAQELETREDVVELTWSFWGSFGARGSITHGDVREGKQIIEFDVGHKTGSIKDFACSVAHEVSHAQEGHFMDSVQEEAQAYAFEFWVGAKLGLHLDNTAHAFAMNFVGLDLNNDRHLETARDYLVEGSTGSTQRVYKSIPYVAPASISPWQDRARMALYVWQGHP